MRIIMLFSLLFSFCCVKAQRVGIGQWDSYFSLSKTFDVAEGDGKIVWVAEYAALYYDFDDKSIQVIGKVEGLSEAGLNKVTYNAATNTFVLGYNNGNLDLLSFDANNAPSIINMNDIKRSPLTGDKTIYDLYSREGLVYVSCGFGIVVLDMARKEVKDTYLVGPSSSQVKVNGVTIGSDTLYATSDNGIYKAYLHHPFLNSSAAWSKLTSLPAWLLNKKFKKPSYVNGQLFVIPDYPAYGNDTAYYRTGSVWTKFPLAHGNDVLNVQQGVGTNIVVVAEQTILHCKADLTLIDQLFAYNNSGYLVLSNGILGSDNFYYTADVATGPYRCINSFSAESLLPGGTKSAAVRRIVTDGDQLWIAPGQVAGTIFANKYNVDFFSVLENNEWTYINKSNNALIDADCYDVMDVAIDPTDSKHVVGAMWAFDGLVEMQDKVVTNVYDEHNSILFSPADYPGFCPVSSVAFDEEGNLWCLNGRSNQPLVVKTKNGDWKSFYCGPASGKTYFDLVIDKNGYKYIPYPIAGTNTGGLLVYNDNGTITDESDDQYYNYTTVEGAGNLPDADVRCVTVDLDGQVWVGTNKGPTVIYNPGNVFSNGSADAQHILIQQDGNTQVLLETEVINCIEVDGANRKWIGTENSGVYLLSEDGQELIYHFTAEDSPLPSNSVADIEINGKTGEVFFATTSGLMSFRGTATESNVNFDETKVFPNPVRPDYDGLIAINGLSRDSDVKVTDIAGNIVNVVKSEGGMATWNGRNLKGERVKSGVYLFLCASEDGSNKVAGKVMFIE